MIVDIIEELIRYAIKDVAEKDIITRYPVALPPTIPIVKTEQSKVAVHGDYSTNIALQLAKQVRIPPQALAKFIISAIPSDDAILRIEYAEPGFINFFVNKDYVAVLQFDVRSIMTNYKNTIGDIDE